MEIGGCPAVVAQWQSTGGSSQRCPGFDSRRLPAFFTFLYLRLITSNFICLFFFIVILNDGPVQIILCSCDSSAV